jgi:hypothetical protein
MTDSVETQALARHVSEALIVRIHRARLAGGLTFWGWVTRAIESALQREEDENAMTDQNIHLHLHLPAELTAALSDHRLLHTILHQLDRMEFKMATIDDLNTAVANIQGTMTANDARVATLANAVSAAATANATADAAMQAEIKRLSDLLAAGGDPAALQIAVDNLTAMSAEGVAQGNAIDAATTALAAAFPPVTPTP